MNTAVQENKSNAATGVERRIADMSLLHWMQALQFGDSTLPTGAFTFSHGLESAIERGLVTDAKTLHSFTKTAVEQAASGDAIAVLHAWRAARKGDLQKLIQIDRAVFNRKLNEEFRSMTVKTGKKLIELADKVINASRDAELLSQWRAKVANGETEGTYPVCLAIIFAVLDIPEEGCFMVHQYGVAMAILSAALRLVKVDHVDTQTILFKLNDTIEQDYAVAAKRRLEDMVGFAPMVDMLAAVHVQAHVRMFMN